MINKLSLCLSVALAAFSAGFFLVGAGPAQSTVELWYHNFGSVKCGRSGATMEEITATLDASTATDTRVATAKATKDYVDAHGGGPASTVPDTGIAFSDTSKGDASTAKHGFFPKLPSPTGKYLKDDFTWDTPVGGSGTVETSAPIQGTGADTDKIRLAKSGVDTDGYVSKEDYSTFAGKGDLSSGGSYSNPSWLMFLAWAKITDAPAITGYLPAYFCADTDSRLSNSRTPTAHTHTEGDVIDLGFDLSQKVDTGRTISGHNLASNIQLVESDVTNLTFDLSQTGDTTRSVNGHALS